ncbi:MAG: hypothetical protein DDT42_00282 [candidate division WS2 bacterium]|uniref:C4-type zinc ribbon domain-containing protein n=1 Tax=Psychracetigena formicireducens TaxID=2986056 RepID=A0A9E2BH16_PSYF1|nr:hypothetical protein [Candidatus Psychracetigena formicireducens]MBT9144441.1 hypothetical protein [Candidatus Psychracetigena formicireducens]
MPILDDLIELQKLEGIKTINLNKKDEISYIIKKISLKKTAKVKEIDNIKEEIHINEVELKDLDLSVESIRVKIKQNEAVLFSGKITSAKEVAFKSQEITNMKKHISEMEDKSLLLMETMETQQTQKKVKEQELNSINTELTTQESLLPSLIYNDEELITDLKEKIPQDILREFYYLFKDKGGYAVVSLKDNLYCGGCGVNVPGKSQLLIQKRELVRCESCHRFLYNYR